MPTVNVGRGLSSEVSEEGDCVSKQEAEDDPSGDSLS